MYKPILCLDFDGVIHMYTSKWTRADEILDGPVPGVFEFMTQASGSFTLYIYSSRSHQIAGKGAMQYWLRCNFKQWEGVKHYSLEAVEKFLLEIQWPNEKPPAFLTIDDRAIQFNGQWPDIQELLNFKPWNKR